jgi:hypothetical protein
MRDQEMTEWQIIESDDFPQASPEKLPTPRRRLEWGLLAGVLILFLSLTALFTLRQQRAQNQSALQEDLSAVIFEEETHRSLGRPDEVFILAAAPLSWKRAYRHTFENKQTDPTAPQYSPGDIQLAEIEFFDGECAVVTVSEAAWIPFPDPIRTYCMTGQGWGRAPLPAAVWGNQQPPYLFSNGVRLQFRERDRAFAQTLAQELEKFFSQINRLPVWSTVSPELVTFDGLEISIEPQDMQPPLILADAQRIIINSPELATPYSLAPDLATFADSDSATFSGETATRLALAKALLLRADSIRTEPTRSLAGAGRWL